jgi:hypothetical protein
MRCIMIRVLMVCLVLSLGTVGLYSQAPLPEVSLDDNPNAPAMGPWVPPFLSAEDEFGLGLPASMAGFIGPSPTLPLMGFFDSDVLVPGPAPFITFPPPPFYVDSISCDHSTMAPCGGGLFVRFSVDRATGGVTPADASWQQAAQNEQPADIFRTDRPYSHVGNFVPLPPGACFAGALPTAGTGVLGGAVNQMMYDHWGTFGFLPVPPVLAPIAPGTHDNIDGFNEWPHSMLDMVIPNPNNFFTMNTASAFLNGVLPGDIFVSPNPPGLMWPTPLFATAAQCGLDCAGPGTDSIDGLALWDNGRPGKLDPGKDYAAFSLAPGSASLGVPLPPPLAGVLSAGDILATDFNGCFYVWLTAGDLGVGPNPSPPLPGVCGCQINVDALDLTIDPEPVPYINPITTPVIDPGTKR